MLSFCIIVDLINLSCGSIESRRHSMQFNIREKEGEWKSWRIFWNHQSVLCACNILEMSLDKFVCARADNVTISAFDSQFIVTELSNDHRWFVSLFSLCQNVSLERECSEDFFLIQCILLGFNSQLELDNRSFECWLGSEAEFITVLREEDRWRNTVADLSEEEANAWNWNA